MKTDLPRWMNRPAAARYSGLSLRSIDRHLKAGTFIARKAGRCRLIDRESLDAWIQGKPAGEVPAVRIELSPEQIEVIAEAVVRKLEAARGATPGNTL